MRLKKFKIKKRIIKTNLVGSWFFNLRFGNFTCNFGTYNSHFFNLTVFFTAAN